MAEQDVAESNAFQGAITSADDLQAIQHCQNGDREAFRHLVHKYQHQVAAIMWKFSRDPVIHEEMIQDVFVEAFTSLPNYRPQAPFFHWLSRIAVRVGYRLWREQKQERKYPQVSLEDWDHIAEGADDSDRLASREAADILHRLLGQLPPRDRLVLTLRFVEERSVKETADLTGWSQTLVKVQTLRARSKLRKLFDKAQLKGEL
ncbi:MAG: RNA polymerase sigma factor [Desulfuromonadaceae bacterium]|nr:RNA polymerase sigma factor [Desulfuromonadaceae bacterium]